jgi:hypothetical protein
MHPHSLFPEATYREQEIPKYRGNRWIEALPPILERAEAVDRMQKLVRVEAAERAAPAQVRLHMVEGIASSFLQPLDAHVGLFSNVSMLLRGGYVQRDPARPEFLRMLLEGARQLEIPTNSAPPQQNLGPGSGHALIGMSGVGKSTAIEAVLGCYQQVIWHPRLHGSLRSVLQLVWLKLSCPHDGSIKDLCHQFFEAVDQMLGTNYTGIYAQRGTTINRLRAGMARVAFIHGLGLLVVDEIQNLNEAKSGGDRLMMNFFKILRDVMKVPVLAIGTKAALNVLGGDLQVARRHAGIPVFEPMKLDEGFEFFCESLFEAQYLRSPVRIMPGTLALLYDLSQGITDIVVQLFVQAQSRALMCGVETLSDDLFREVYADCFGLLHTFLEIMRRGNDVTDGHWDAAMLKARSAAQNSAARSPLSSTRPVLPGPSLDLPPQAPARAPGKVSGVKKRRVRREKGEESRCKLVEVAEGAMRDEVPVHEALWKAGFIRGIGAEALGT